MPARTAAGDFDRLQSLDAAHLDLATRAKMLQRIQALQARDQQLAQSLELHRNDMAKRLTTLQQGRSVTRGYRVSDTEAPESKSGTRIA